MSSSVFSNSVGYDLDLFDDAKDKKFLEDNFLCTICLMVCRNAVQTNNLRVAVKNKLDNFESCGHLFCEECIQTYLSQKSQCATCRTTLYKNELQPCHVARRLIAQAKIKCIHHKEGCQWTGEIGKDSNNILSHLSNSCDFYPRPCPFNSLHEHLPVADMKEHEKVCNNRPVQCEHCKRSLIFRDLEPHLTLSCPVVSPISCPFNASHPLLCPETMELHKKQCPDRDCPCPQCGETVRLSRMSSHILDSCYQTIIACPNGCFNHYSNRMKESKEICPVSFKVSGEVSLDSVTVDYLRTQSQLAKKHSQEALKNRWTEKHHLAADLLHKKHVPFGSTVTSTKPVSGEQEKTQANPELIKGICLLNTPHDKQKVHGNDVKCLLLDNSSLEIICSVYMNISHLCTSDIHSNASVFLSQRFFRYMEHDHLLRCPLEKIDCPYKKFGCTFPPYSRHLMDLHLADDFKTHSQLIDKNLSQYSLSVLQSLYSNSLSGATDAKDSKDSTHSLNPSEPYLMKFPGFGNVRPVSFFDDKLWRKKLKVGDLVDYQGEKDVWYLSTVQFVAFNQDAWSIECKGKKPVGYVTRSSITIQPPWTRSGGRVGPSVHFPRIRHLALEPNRFVPPPEEYEREIFIPSLNFDVFPDSIPSGYLTVEFLIQDFQLRREPFEQHSDVYFDNF